MAGYVSSPPSRSPRDTRTKFAITISDASSTRSSRRTRRPASRARRWPRPGTWSSPARSRRRRASTTPRSSGRPWPTSATRDSEMGFDGTPARSSPPSSSSRPTSRRASARARACTRSRAPAIRASCSASPSTRRPSSCPRRSLRAQARAQARQGPQVEEGRVAPPRRQEPGHASSTTNGKPVAHRRRRALDAALRRRQAQEAQARPSWKTSSRSRSPRSSSTRTPSTTSTRPVASSSAAPRRLRPHGPQDHRRHLRRHGPSRRRRLLGQGPDEGRPLAPATTRATSRRTSSPPASPTSAKSRSRTRSASRSPSASTSTRSAPASVEDEKPSELCALGQGTEGERREGEARAQRESLEHEGGQEVPPRQRQRLRPRVNVRDFAAPRGFRPPGERRSSVRAVRCPSAPPILTSPWRGNHAPAFNRGCPRG
jgi:hypothetical protein